MFNKNVTKIQVVYTAFETQEVEYYPNGSVKRVVFKSAEELKKLAEANLYKASSVILEQHE